MPTQSLDPELFKPEVWITRKAIKYVRKQNRTTRKVCNDQKHARNYSMSIVRQTRKDGSWAEVIKVRVWLTPDTSVSWTPEKGWSDIEHSQRFINYFTRTFTN